MLWKLSKIILWKKHSSALLASKKEHQERINSTEEVPQPKNPKLFSAPFFLQILATVAIVKAVLVIFTGLYELTDSTPRLLDDKQTVLKSTIYNDPFLVHTLYQMMKDAHEVFEVAQIPYWVDWGTALGALRHDGLIPWDDGLDLDLLEKDAKRIEALAPVFISLGYQLSSTPFGYSISPAISPTTLPGLSTKYHTTELQNYPSLDIFLFDIDEPSQRVVHATELGKACWSSNYFPLKSVENRVLHSFGSFQVYLCDKMGIELDRHFGPEWKTTAIFFHRQMSNFSPPAIRWELSKEECSPAQPFNSVSDRVKNHPEVIDQIQIMIGSLPSTDLPLKKKS